MCIIFLICGFLKNQCKLYVQFVTSVLWLQLLSQAVLQVSPFVLRADCKTSPAATPPKTGELTLLFLSNRLDLSGLAFLLTSLKMKLSCAASRLLDDCSLHAFMLSE